MYVIILKSSQSYQLIYNKYMKAFPIYLPQPLAQPLSLLTTSTNYLNAQHAAYMLHGIVMPLMVYMKMESKETLSFAGAMGGRVINWKLNVNTM